MNPFDQYVNLETRRQFFGKLAKGFGMAALSSLGGNAFSSMSSGPSLGGLANGALGATHFPANAKRGIYLFMSGAPSQMDMFDYKPKMKELFDTDLPDTVRDGQRLTGMTSAQSSFPIAPDGEYYESQVDEGRHWVSWRDPFYFREGQRGW